MWYAEDARPIEGACGVTSALIGIERCETERRRSRSDADSGGPAPGAVLLLTGRAERVEEGARIRREEVREEYVPVLCAFEGVGVGDGPDKRARLLWYDDGAREDVCEDVCSRGEAGTANVAFLESGGVVSTSSAFRLPFAVSERTGDDTGVWVTAPSDEVATPATRDMEGM